MRKVKKHEMSTVHLYKEIQFNPPVSNLFTGIQQNPTVLESTHFCCNA